MPLISIRLIALSAAITLAVAAGTVLLWRRNGRWRHVSRVLGVLLTEAFLVLTAGLIVNRSEQFYPTWKSLTVTAENESEIVAPTPDGLLDGYLRQYTERDGDAVAPWQPAGWKAWNLGGAPTLTAPAAYLAKSTSSFPVVLALTGAKQKWDTAKAGALAKEIGAPAVMLVTPVSQETTATDLGVTIPTEISHDLRVHGFLWALVAPIDEAVKAVQVIAVAPNRFTSLVLVADTAGATVPAEAQVPKDIPVAVVHPAQPAGRRHDTAENVAGDIALRCHPSSLCEPGPPGLDPGGPERSTGNAAGAVQLRSADGREWATALRWACAQTPAPLAPPAVLTPFTPTGK